MCPGRQRHSRIEDLCVGFTSGAQVDRALNRISGGDGPREVGLAGLGCLIGGLDCTEGLRGSSAEAGAEFGMSPFWLAKP